MAHKIAYAGSERTPGWDCPLKATVGYDEPWDSPGVAEGWAWGLGGVAAGLGCAS